ncbi:MAG TPA: hypothetical protein DCR40_17175 [Prolixibacteraceae bacterium]|nr:hypothetical protein [Prolixibacteraceae bacterium]
MEINSTNPKEDLQAIREIMERSSKFLSLSGLSGIFAGVCALIGAAVAWFVVLGSGNVHYDEYYCSVGATPFNQVSIILGIDAIIVLIAAFLGAYYFSSKKAKKSGQKLWTSSTRRLLGHLFIPLVSGGIFVLILAFRNNIDLIASAMLIFYGLSLVNAGKFTLGEIHYLGLTEIVLGVLAGIFILYGLLFWVIGFGVMHIVYGIVMYYRYER